MNTVVFGGYGTFGRLVAEELVRGGIQVTIAGRDLAKAEQVAAQLGCHGKQADIASLEACRAALAGQRVAVNCAGPYSQFDATLLEACLEAGCHYADIADDRRFCAQVRSLDERFRERDLAAVYGCSSLPAISGALGLIAREGLSASPARARVTLLIGNDNPKGRAAIESLVRSLGQPIQAPQGVIRGFRDPEAVELPAPFGRKKVCNVESPEYDLFPALLGVRSVAVKVGFELALSTYSFAFLALPGWKYGRRTSRFLEWVARIMPRVGTSGGAVLTELFADDGTSARAALVGARDGQRMAALPCALAAQALCADATDRGALTAYDLLGARRLLDLLKNEGFELSVPAWLPPSGFSASRD